MRPVRAPHIAGGVEAGESVAAVTAAQPPVRRHKKPSGQQTFAPDRESDAVAAAAAFSAFKTSRLQSPLRSEGWEKKSRSDGRNDLFHSSVSQVLKGHQSNLI